MDMSPRQNLTQKCTLVYKRNKIHAFIYLCLRSDKRLGIYIADIRMVCGIFRIAQHHLQRKVQLY